MDINELGFLLSGVGIGAMIGVIAMHLATNYDKRHGSN
jgi:hypothetical protein